MRVHVWICAVLMALRGASALASGLDTIGQKSGQTTRLGLRLAPISARNDRPPFDADYWRAARAIIETSDAVKDASDDTAAGHAGFMTHANDAIAESPIAPGLKCFDRSETSRRAVFLFAYVAPMAREAGGALLAFDGYARLYNAQIFKSGALGETSCVSTGW